MGKGRFSEDTSTSEDKGLISDFNNWRGEKGECSRLVVQKNKKDPIGDGTVSSEPTFGLQKVDVSRSQYMDGPLKDFLDNVDKEVGLAVRDHGLQIISRSQSLEGHLKDYLEELEQAFIRAKLRRNRPSQIKEVQPMVIKAVQNVVSAAEETSSDRSVSRVCETTDLS